MTPGVVGLNDAITHYMEWISDIAASGDMLPDDEWDAPLFSYILTKKQFSDLQKICDENDWPPPDNPGITFYPKTLKHILTSRSGKDNLSWQDIAQIITAALNGRSTVAKERGYEQAVIVLNSIDVVRIGALQEKYRGMLLVEVTINDLAPKTAYHASEAKSRAIIKRTGI